MRVEKFLLSMSVLFFVAGPAMSQASADGNFRAVLQSRYAAMKAAMAARDANAIASVLAPNFVSIDTSGNRENAAKMIAEVKALPQDPHKTGVTTLVSVWVKQNTAII